MLSAVKANMRAAVVPIIGAPMTSAMRSNMRASVPVMVVLDRRGVIVIVVFIVVSLRKASEADDQG
jgi:hypothetical protein